MSVLWTEPTRRIWGRRPLRTVLVDTEFEFPRFLKVSKVFVSRPCNYLFFLSLFSKEVDRLVLEGILLVGFLRMKLLAFGACGSYCIIIYSLQEGAILTN